MSVAPRTPTPNAANLLCLRVDNADAVANPVGYDNGVSIRSDGGDSGPLTHSDSCNLSARLQIDDRHIVGAGVCDVGSSTVITDRDEIGPLMNWDSGDDRIFFGVDDADGIAASIHDVDFVALRIHSHAGGVGADADDSILAKIDDIEDRDRVTAAIGDVSVFAVVGGIIRKLMRMTTRDRKQRYGNEQ